MDVEAASEEPRHQNISALTKWLSGAIPSSASVVLHMGTRVHADTSSQDQNSVVCRILSLPMYVAQPVVHVE